MLQWSSTSFKCWSEINVFWDNASWQKRIHTVFNVRFCNWWRICKRVISEVFWENSLWLEHLVWAPRPNTKFFKLNVRYASLRPSILKWVWHWQRVFLSESSMPCYIFWISCQLPVFLFSHLSSRVPTFFHNNVCWSWAWTHGMLRMSNRFVSSFYVRCWHPDFFVAKTHIGIKVIFNLVDMILELSQWSWDAFSLRHWR